MPQNEIELDVLCNNISKLSPRLNINRTKIEKKDSLYKKKLGDDFIKEGITELDYYLIHNYINAWYDDNVGSFLVVIERKK